MSIKTPVIIFVVLLLLSVQAFSQRRNQFTAYSSETQFSVGAELVAVFPNGFGGGASVRYEQPLKVIENLSVLATVGFIAYGTSNTYDIGVGSYTAKTNAIWVPVLGGAKYYYPGPVLRGLYGSFEAGFGFGSGTVTYTGNITGASNDPATLGNFTVAPGIGYHSGMIDFSLRYFTVGLIGLRAAYVFKIRK
jgi:hypothetical protein